MAVTPAGAEVSSAMATNWKKIWKKNLKPQADKRYYTKKQSDKKYTTKADAATTYQPKGAYEAAGSGYTKAESDARYPSRTQVIRGTFLLGGTEAAGGGFLIESLSFGTTLSAAPTPHFIAPGDPVPAGCLGSAAAPDAQPGHLCVFETIRTNVAASPNIFASTGLPGTDPVGALMTTTSAAAGSAYVAGSWAVRPAAVAAGRMPSAPSDGRTGTLGITR